ncbi:MAG: hypothetical protein HY760_01620 [Nitrospirae bacterium]|nr:hypothetical protein [Nitrospirota bacterium]
MRYWFYTLYVVVMGIIIMILDVTLGKLYVRYMVFLTGTIFMLGMLVGEGMEQRAAKRRKAEGSSPEEEPLEPVRFFHSPASKNQGGYPVSRSIQPAGGSMTVGEASE